VLTLPHHHYIAARRDALNLFGDLVREALLQLQPVGELMGDPGELGEAEQAILCDIGDGDAIRESGHGGDEALRIGRRASGDYRNERGQAGEMVVSDGGGYGQHCIQAATLSFPTIYPTFRVSRAIMWFTLTFRDRWRSRFENSQPQQIETCTTIPATLDQLQAIDVAFDRPGAVR